MKKIILYFIETVIVFALTYVVFDYMVLPVTINGSSMDNTLEHGDIVLLNALQSSKDDIERFDIVVAHSSLLHEEIIKRVIGLPGDHLKMVDDVLYVNDMVVNETYLDERFVYESQLRYNTDYFTDDFEVTLRDDEYFLLGDNRLKSTDSRVLGPFSSDDILGIGGLIVYPFDHIEWLDY